VSVRTDSACKIKRPFDEVIAFDKEPTARQKACCGLQQVPSSLADAGWCGRRGGLSQRQ
jgi:hypothetical protein